MVGTCGPWFSLHNPSPGLIGRTDKRLETAPTGRRRAATGRAGGPTGRRAVPTARAGGATGGGGGCTGCDARSTGYAGGSSGPFPSATACAFPARWERERRDAEEQRRREEKN